MRPRRRILAAATLCFLFFPQLMAQSGHSNVILITIDTWRHDYLGKSGSGKVKTPVLDALADDGAWFESAYCQVPLTPPSHASILTGLYPASHGIRDFTSGPLRPSTVTLASILKSQGYQTAAFLSALVLDSIWGLDKGFDLYADDFAASGTTSAGNVQRRAGETIDLALRWLEGQTTPEKPYFLWIHLFDPHHDYNPPQAFRNQYPNDPYAGEVAYVDAQVGRLIASLKRRNEYDSAVIVAVSDHGESLGEHGEPNHGLLLYETTVRIPLIIKPPSQFKAAATRVVAPAETVDILPTILQSLRIPTQAQWRLEGRGRLSAVMGKADRRPSQAYSESLYALNTFGWSPLYSYRDGRYKLIRAPRPELYDLQADPGELHNLYEKRQALADKLGQGLAELRARLESGEIQTTEAPDAEAVERLAALGYAALARPVKVDSVQGLLDPKDQLDVYRRIVRALDASEAGKPAQANQLLIEVARMRPELFIVHYSIGLNQMKLGRHREALLAFDKARSLNPDYLSIDLNRAKAQTALGLLQEAETTLRSVLKRRPLYPSAQMRLANLLRLRGRPAQAAEVYENLLKNRPHDRAARKRWGMSLIDARDFRRGLKALEDAAEDPPDALSLNYRGIALANLGRIPEALDSYRQALATKPDYSQARLNLAFALKRSGQDREAFDEFEKLCKARPALCKRYRNRFEVPEGK